MVRRWPGTDDREQVLVKVCGVCTVEDAEMCAEEGVDAVGLNFWPGSSRRVDVEEAKRIVSAVADSVTVVGLFVDAGEEEVRATRASVGFEWVQLHGAEPPATLAALGPKAFKALRVRDAGIEAEAARYGGPLLLLDAWAPGQMGGTGAQFDWALASLLSSRRPVVLAGGLDSTNVAEAVRQVRPRAVDVASGVESAPGIKLREKVAAFVAAARAAV